ncbi:MAG: hypothetical protein HY036_04650 [Nitrospirae bacterium]|nr:hypothetical protein [Nitrospirota bacterium]MBI3351850.1 hypothetical protein [Nitrospirota bacterium]
MGHKNSIRHRVPQPIRGTAPKISDPYLPREGMPEPAKCKICQSVYHHKRWYAKDDPFALQAQNEPMELTVCPACRKAKDHFPGGVVTLRGGYLVAHKDQILHLIRNEETRAKKDNPLEVIFSVKDMGNRIEIHTTNEKLAQRIGKEIHRAFKGEVSYHWTHDLPHDKFVRVEWHREAEKE